MRKSFSSVLIATMALSLSACGNAGLSAARRGDIDGLNSWLRSGQDINSRGENGMTALHAAAQAGQAKTISWLISKGANPNLVDDDGDTPLCLVFKVKKSPNEVAVSRALAKGGADVNKKCSGGFTPMHYASLDYRWDTLIPLLEKGAKTQTKYSKAQEPLSKAALSARADVVALMLKNGVDPNVHHGAAIFDALNTPQKDSWDVVKLLVEHGINLKFKQKGDGTGDTALHRVVLLRDYGSARIVDIMVSHGADPYSVNRNNQLPLDTALQKSRAISDRMFKHMALELPGADPLKKAYDKMVMAGTPGPVLDTIERMMAAAGYLRVQARLMSKGLYDGDIKDAKRASLIPVMNSDEADDYLGLVRYATALVGALANAAADAKLDKAKARENFENLMTTITDDVKNMQEKRRRRGAGKSPASVKILKVVKLLKSLETSGVK